MTGLEWHAEEFRQCLVVNRQLLQALEQVRYYHRYVSSQLKLVLYKIMGRITKVLMQCNVTRYKMDFFPLCFSDCTLFL